MKKLVLAAAIGAVALTSCGSEEGGETPTPDTPDTTATVVTPEEEEPQPVATEMPEKYNDFSVTESGLRYKIHRAGDGPKIGIGDKCKVHYKGMFTSGTQFDASYDRGEPFEVVAGLDMVIQGWNEGIPMLSVGDSAELYIPWEIAYGENGRATIPGKADLIFIIEPTEITYDNDFDYSAYEKNVTETGLTYFIIEPGEGDLPTFGNTVDVHYTGTFTDGTQFDSSEGKSPFSFSVGAGQVIQGWDEVVQLMPKGSKIRAVIPFYLAYGERGRPGIPPYSTLVFDMEMMGIN